jgi:molecular chaperone DnaK (HSP70)
MKKHSFVTNDIVGDERGLNAWKITRAAHADEKEVVEILYSEEVVSMMLSYVRMLAEIQSGSIVRDCVITVPSWFTYDQRVMLRDAAEKMAGLTVL